MCADTAPVPAGSAKIVVELVHAVAPHQVERLRLALAAGTTTIEALQRSGWADRLSPGGAPGLRLGLGGRLCDGSTVLRDGDRLELLRTLTVDPQEARRLRYRRDGLKQKQRRPRERPPEVLPG